MSIIYFILFMHIGHAPAQDGSVHIEHLGLEEGLSQSLVTCIFPDSRGFIWVGTGDGLNLYDGYKFSTFKHNPSDPTSLNNNFILCIFEDSRGIIWVGTEGGGLNQYNPQTGLFTYYVHDPQDSTSIVNNRVFVIYEAPSSPGVLWLGTNGGLERIDITQADTQLRFQHYRHDPDYASSLSSNYIRSIFEDSQENFWVGTGDGLNILNRHTGKCIRYQPIIGDTTSLSGAHIQLLVEDADGNIWINTDHNGLNRFDRSNNCFIRYPQDQLTFIGYNRDGKAWLDTPNGQIRMHPNRHRFALYMQQLTNPNTMSQNGLVQYHWFEEGIIWVCSNSGGINKIVFMDKGFEHIHTGSSPGMSLAYNSVYALQESRIFSGRIWIGTVGGALSWYDIPDKQITTDFIYGAANGKNETIHVRSVYEDQLGRVWLGTTDGLKRFEPKTGIFHHFVHDSTDTASHPSENTVNVLLIDPLNPDLLWVGFDIAGLGCFDMKRESFTYYTHNPTDYLSIGNNRITALLSAGNNKIWIGTKQGLNLFDLRSGHSIRYGYNSNDPAGLSHPHIKSLHQDASRSLWVGTAGGGINRLSWPSGEPGDESTVQIKRYTEDDGLPNNVVYGILEDEDGQLWLSTNGGLGRFDPIGESFQYYDQSDGLQSTEFNTGAFCRCRDGQMLFGGIGGLNLFHPSKININTHAPPVVITDFQIFNESVHPGPGSLLSAPITATRAITLSHRDYVFSFQFTALDYVNPAKNRYAYMLEGFQNQWNEIGTRRFVTFTNIPHGDYTFRVKACNNDGVWNETGTVLQIHITPPWWKTTWATLLFVMAGLAIIISISRFWIYKERMKSQLHLKQMEAEKSQELDQMKSRFLANISHEFRTPLTLIMGTAEQLIAENHNKQVIEFSRMQKKNGSRLLRQVNQLLDLSKLESGRMNLQAKEKDIIPLVRSISLSFESFARQQDIDLTFRSKPKSVKIFYDHEKMETIVSNLISNAVKFTPAGGRVEITISKNQLLKIQVSDTGTGIPPEQLPHIFDRFYQAGSGYTKDQKGSGIGLALTRELVQLHHGQIKATSEKGKGSVFTVQLPLGREHLEDEEIIPIQDAEISPPATNSFVEENPEPQKVKMSMIDDPEAPILLIVEDNDDMRAYIRYVLSDCYRIEEAADGEAGFSKAAELIPDLIISDVMMPKMDGYQMCDKLKSDDRTNHIPVIILTARSGRESRLEGLEQGADDFLIKPFESVELKMRIQNLIDQRCRLKEHFRKEVLFGSENIIKVSAEQDFINRAAKVLDKHLQNPDLDITSFAKEIGLSRSQLHRKLHGVLNQSTTEFIRSLRLKKAAALLKEKTAPVSEIAYLVGFNNHSYFSKCFKEQFGISPTEYENT